MCRVQHQEESSPPARITARGGSRALATGVWIAGAILLGAAANARAQEGPPGGGGGRQMRPGALLRAVEELDLTPAQRSKVQAILEDAHDDRYRFQRKGRQLAQEALANTRDKVTAVFTDARKETVGKIFDDAAARIGDGDDDGEGPAEGPGGPEDARRGPPGPGEKDGSRGGPMGPGQGRRGPMWVRIVFERCQQRVMTEVQMSDAESEKVIKAFRDARESSRTKMDDLRAQMDKVKQKTRERILEVLDKDQKAKFEKLLQQRGGGGPGMGPGMRWRDSMHKPRGGGLDSLE